MPNLKTKAAIGKALENIRADVIAEAIELVFCYRNHDHLTQEQRESLVRFAVDTPTRAKARVQNWIAEYDASNGAGSGAAFLNECLSQAGSSETVSSLNAQITALESQALAIRDDILADVLTYEDAADSIEAAYERVNVDFTYRRLAVPDGYTTVWGDPW